MRIASDRTLIIKAGGIVRRQPTTKLRINTLCFLKRFIGICSFNRLHRLNQIFMLFVFRLNRKTFRTQLCIFFNLVHVVDKVVQVLSVLAIVVKEVKKILFYFSE